MFVRFGYIAITMRSSYAVPFTHTRHSLVYVLLHVYTDPYVYGVRDHASVRSHLDIAAFRRVYRASFYTY